MGGAKQSRAVSKRQLRAAIGAAGCCLVLALGFLLGINRFSLSWAENKDLFLYVFATEDGGLRFQEAGTYVPNWDLMQGYVYLDVEESFISLGPFYPVADRVTTKWGNGSNVNPSLREATLSLLRERYLELHAPKNEDHIDAAVLQLFDQPSSPGMQQRINWFGLILNAVTIAALVGFVVFGLRVIQESVRASRRIRGLCPFCAYSMADHAGGPCPECGKEDAVPAHSPPMTITSGLNADHE